MKSKTFNTEKQLVNHIKKQLENHKINCIKTHGDLFLQGYPDLIVFNKFYAYGIEVKKSFKGYKPSALQVATARKMQHNFLYIFVDENNYRQVILNVLNNNLDWLIHYRDTQLNFWSTKYETTL